MQCRLFTISGTVQGVFFRASTRAQAESLGIQGHAINLANGQVEVLACGDVKALEQLAAWLNQGPERAVVEQVQQAPARPEQPPVGFTTG